MNEKRGSWHLLTGAILGLLVGLAISLWVIPLRYINTDPSMLGEDGRDQYRNLVAQAYLAEGDANRAQARLMLLKESNAGELLVVQAQELLAAGGSDQDARAIALLAAVINDPSMVITPLPQFAPQFTATPESALTETLSASGPTRTPAATSTPRPTPTPRPTTGSPFKFESQSTQCDENSTQSLLQVWVKDAIGQPVSGVRIEISQVGGGVQTFYTGFYPEISVGYADFEMLAGMVYAIRVGENSLQVQDLSIPTCEDGSPGDLILNFTQP
jgi:protocatechuate 3,4-dioxygenase beta subunit